MTCIDKNCERCRGTFGPKEYAVEVEDIDMPIWLVCAYCALDAYEIMDDTRDHDGPGKITGVNLIQ